MKTRKSFYRALKKVANKFEWKLDSGLNIRRWANYNEYCPITAVSFGRFKNQYKTTQLIEAAQKLGLSKNDAEMIGSAADHNEEYLNYNKGKFEKINPRVRKALLRAVGL